jgi:hypothetical protein
MIVKTRTCNCTRALLNGKPFYLKDGIIRTLLESMYPKWKFVPKAPCEHWVESVIEYPINSLRY